MESLTLLIPLSVLVVLAVGALFAWALRGGQFDDLEGPAYRILMEDEAAVPVDPDQSPARAPRENQAGAGAGRRPG